MEQGSDSLSHLYLFEWVGGNDTHTVRRTTCRRLRGAPLAPGL